MELICPQILIPPQIIFIHSLYSRRKWPRVFCSSAKVKVFWHPWPCRALRYGFKPQNCPNIKISQKTYPKFSPPANKNLFRRRAWRDASAALAPEDNEHGGIWQTQHPPTLHHHHPAKRVGGGGFSGGVDFLSTTTSTTTKTTTTTTTYTVASWI